MAFFDWFRYQHFSEREYIIVLTVHFIVLITYTVVIILALMNIWQILIKLQKWRTISLLFFYIFTILCILIRFLNLISYGIDHDRQMALILFTLQPIAKICVGLIQCWMIFELSIRIKASNRDYDYIRNSEKWLNRG